MEFQAESLLSIQKKSVKNLERNYRNTNREQSKRSKS